MNMPRRRRRRGGPRRDPGASPLPATPAILVAVPAEGPVAGRVARIERKTRETEILVQLNVDGTGQASVRTTIAFLDHMLEAMTKHGLMDLKADARGDTDVDLHHTIEDVGICLGKAFHEALGDKRGITRFGSAFVPMDEALASVHVDIAERPYFSYNVPLAKARIGNFDVDLIKDFFRAFATNAMVNLHVNLHYGENLHHVAEALFKAFGRALAQAASPNPRMEGVPSTKGAL